VRGQGANTARQALGACKYATKIPWLILRLFRFYPIRWPKLSGLDCDSPGWVDGAMGGGTGRHHYNDPVLPWDLPSTTLGWDTGRAFQQSRRGTNGAQCTGFVDHGLRGTTCVGMKSFARGMGRPRENRERGRGQPELAMVGKGAGDSQTKEGGGAMGVMAQAGFPRHQQPWTNEVERPSTRRPGAVTSEPRGQGDPAYARGPTIRGRITFPGGGPFARYIKSRGVLPMRPAADLWNGFWNPGQRGRRIIGDAPRGSFREMDGAPDVPW